MSKHPIDLVTGAFGYTGGQIADLLQARGRGVRTLTFHPERSGAGVEVMPYRFDDPAGLTRSLEGVETLYNTYWVRFDHGRTSFDNAVENSRLLFAAARRAGVRRIVHVSITNPSIESELPYFRGKARVEYALAETGLPYSIVRPTWVFGGRKDILANNIAWILRRMPLFAIPGDGSYPVQPVHVEDLARLCVESAEPGPDLIIDAAGPEAMTFAELVAMVRDAVGTRAPVLHVPPALMAMAARALGVLVRDVVLRPDEIRGLMSGLLVSADPPLGRIRFSEWLAAHAETVGSAYANELRRHFAIAR